MKVQGMRILLNLPELSSGKIIIGEDTKKELLKELLEKSKNLTVFAVGNDVSYLNVGDSVYIRPEELIRGSFVEIGGESKLMVNALSVDIIW